MRRFFTLLFCTATVGVAVVGQTFGADGDEDSRAPNFIVVLVDDLGWTDVGCYGSKYYETPHIDRLAATGIRMTDAYAACAVCSPTRAAVLTGRYPARHGITDWIRPRIGGGAIPEDRRNPAGFENHDRKLLTPQNHLWMELGELTVAELLRKSGYETCYIGKWHLGADDWYPNKQGFTINVGGCDYGQPPRYFFPYGTKRAPAMPGLETGAEGEYLTDREAAEAVTFIRENQEKPFLLYLAHHAVHTPIQAKPNLISKFEAKDKAGQKSAEYAAMIASVDEALGRIVATLEELKLDDDTVILFTSDNGGLVTYTNNSPLRGGKGMPYEGGIRVPFIVRWPGVVQENSVSSVPVCSVDLFPTILEIAEVVPPDDLTVDGESLVGILYAEEDLEREALFWHFPHYRGTDATPYGIVRSGDYKLLQFYEDSRLELYNLKNDIGEQKDLSAEQPERAQQLEVMLSKWLVGVGAKMPKPNPDFKPTKSPK